MATSDILASVPKMNFGSDIIYWVIGIILFLVIGAGVVGVLYWFLTFNQKIRIFRKVDGKVILVGNDRAKPVRVSKTWDFLWFCRKSKKWVNRPTIESAPKTWDFYIREDGEWINFKYSLPDIDQIMKDDGVFYIHEDMRMNRISNSQLLRERYNEKPFWQTYGMMIVGVGVLIIIIILLVLLVDKGMVLADKLNGLISSADQILQSAKNIQSGGASLVPAG